MKTTLVWWWFSIRVAIRRFWIGQVLLLDPCEGCARRSEHYDPDGIPLCESCWTSLNEEERRW